MKMKMAIALVLAVVLQDSPKRRQKEGYWTTIEQDFHWRLEILPQVFPIAGF